MPYSEWVQRNKGTCCITCGSKDNLECHHIVKLDHFISGYYDFYGDEEETFKHVVDLHRGNCIEGVSLCQSCHQKKHSGRQIINTKCKVRTDAWSVIPRNFKVVPNHSSKEHRTGTIGLIAYLTMIGLGWSIMNGDVVDRMIKINRRRFAELIHKTACTSFNNSLDNALDQLQEIGVIFGHHRKGNDIEIYFDPDYIDMIRVNPWFIPMEEINTDSMCVLSLKIHLMYQSTKLTYKIGLDKLKTHLGITVQSKSAALSAIEKAVEKITWVKMSSDEFLTFSKTGHAPTPLWGLRELLVDAMRNT